MKKKNLFSILIAVVFTIIAISLFSCTENERARSFGGERTINLEPGVKLINATWKKTDLWYLTEPMEAGYTPKTIKFVESSSFGVMEGTVIFIEQPFTSQR